MGQPLKFSQASYVVDRPRDCDAVGGALRNAYGRQELPNDMQALLDSLDGIEQSHDLASHHRR